MLTVERLKELVTYCPERGVLVWLGGRRAGQVAGYTRPDGYQRVCVDGKFYLGHRLIWLYHYGALPEQGQVIDHIDGNTANSRIDNLRAVAHRVNLTNTKKHRAGHLPGVYQIPSGKWRANCQGTGKRRHIGYFTTAEEAHKAYLEALGTP